MGGLCMANGNNNALGFGTDCNPSKVPLGATSFRLHDAVDQAVVPLLAGFPYGPEAVGGKGLDSGQRCDAGSRCHGAAGHASAVAVAAQGPLGERRGQGVQVADVGQARGCEVAHGGEVRALAVFDAVHQFGQQKVHALWPWPGHARAWACSPACR